MTGPTVYFFLGAPPGTDYGACVQQLDIWQECLNGVGTWEIIADPTGPCNWPAVNTIAADTQVHIMIDNWAVPPVAQTMMRGYVDDVLPYLDSKGYHTRLYRLKGRNRGMDLAQHYVTADYIATRGDLIITNALGLTPAPVTEIVLLAVGAVPGNVLDYEADRTYLADLVREVANQSTNAAGTNNYDFYVDNRTWAAGNAQLNFFLHGGSASGVTLIDVPNSLLNNILDIQPCGEEVGFDIKNDIEVVAGGLSDHYTDLNAVDWVGTNCTVSDLVAVPPAVPARLNGKGAIRADLLVTGGVQPVIDFDLAAPGMSATYGYASMDLTEPTIGSYNYYLQDTLNLVPNLNIRLRDTALNEIEFHRLETGLLVAGGDFNVTEFTILGGPGPIWRKVDFPLGYGTAIEPVQIVGDTKGHWYYFLNPAPPFNWDAVERIRFTTTGQNLNPLDFFIIDGLEFPNHDVRSVQQDGPGAGTSITLYGRRMQNFSRPDIKNQYELNNAAADYLVRLKDPKETIRVTAIGQTGNPFAAQTIDVVAPQFGIGGPGVIDTIVYRIIRLHHRVVKNSDESNFPGYTYTTEYDLVRHEYRVSGNTQLVEHTDIIKTTTPMQSVVRKRRLQQRYRRRSTTPRLMP